MNPHEEQYLLGANLGSEPALCHPGQSCKIILGGPEVVLVELLSPGPAGRIAERLWVDRGRLVTPEVYNARLSRIQVAHASWRLDVQEFLAYGELAPGIKVTPARSQTEPPLVIELGRDTPRKILTRILAAITASKASHERGA